MRTLRLSLCALFVFLPSANAQEPAACRATEASRALDFWVGDWDVFVGGDRAGTNRITVILDGCGVTEDWLNIYDQAGHSLFYFDVARDIWHQVWVTPNTGTPGGLKLKEMMPFPDSGGAVRFEGEITRPDGSGYLDRTTLTPLPDGNVRQHIEVSEDGETWLSTFNAIYVPADE